MSKDIFNSNEYKNWLKEIKSKISVSQIKAALKVNSELLNLYWELGKDINEKQESLGWGNSVVKQLSKDLTLEFDSNGFSSRNLFYIQKWYLFYSDEKVQQVVALLENNKKLSKLAKLEEDKSLIKPLLLQIPWGHHINIITKCKNIDEAIFYVIETIQNNWSRSILVHQIESKLYERQGKAITNFELTLPKPQSDLAKETLKNPYNFDFLTLGKEAQERDIEDALVKHITNFLLELGAGFAYVGRQYHLKVSQNDYYLDLLFYHLKLRCYVVIELKSVPFEPEFAGKLNFYLSAVDDLVKTEHDNPTIGILLCKSKEKIIAEYALRDINKPMGISEYKLTESIPENLKGSLPSIEDLERELEN